MRLIQLSHPEHGRRVAHVEDDKLRLLESHDSIYGLAGAALVHHSSLAEIARVNFSEKTLDYDPIYEGRSDWRILPAFDHPEEPSRCLVSGTGLTHLASAQNRSAMHAAGAPVTDSMRMYDWGVEGGRPAKDCIGTQPEWFYKGNGTVLRAHNQTLDVPRFAEDGGEEAEIAGIYIIDHSKRPRRVGFATGNEFSDHVMEKRNYLYLAPSKLRNCSIGPELLVDGTFDDIRGEARVERNGAVIWSKPLKTGESHMCHSLANIEHHHFKYEVHCRPGDVHIHFFGAGAFSFGEGIALEPGDVMQAQFEGFGRPLRNPIAIDRSAQVLATVHPL